MSLAHIKSFAVGNGDTFYIRHNSDNFTIIDCDLNDDNADAIIEELKEQSADKGVTRFISTHPDDDHFGGIERLDAAMQIRNFYVVTNDVIKEDETESFKHYCKLRDDTDKAFYIYKGCTRRWMNRSSDERSTAGITILWPDTSNQHFKEALADAELGLSANNMSAVVRYELTDGASFLWLGDLETDFMEKITDDINLTKTTVVFAANHGRKSGKIPDAWLEKLDPQIIVIGEAPSRHLHYYTGYKIITQNRAGDITFDLEGDKVHIYASNPDYSHKALKDEQQNNFPAMSGASRSKPNIRRSPRSEALDSPYARKQPRRNKCRGMSSLSSVGPTDAYNVLRPNADSATPIADRWGFCENLSS